MSRKNSSLRIADLMEQSGVGFGTSGARGRVEDMTDRVCYAYTLGFLQYLEETGDLEARGRVAVGGDLRPSTDRIEAAVARAALDRGHTPVPCGRLPSPALALYGLEQQIPAVMITGSHIPADRNGIKFNKPAGEILKADEAGIRAQTAEIPADLFDAAGAFLAGCAPRLPSPSPEAERAYLERYLKVFPMDCLAGLRLGLYEHSAVGRGVVGTVLERLGAQVVRLGHSDAFVPVDTEAIRPEDAVLARRWAAEVGFHALVSTDGDSDRPLVADGSGTWLRGDVAGILCARFLQADAVVVPVSCNTAVDRCGFFRQVRRTRIGSPYVIEGMQQARAEGFQRVVGYEANGGFLTETPLPVGERSLPALPTRDALIVALTILAESVRSRRPVSTLVADLPCRSTASDRIQQFPTALSHQRLAAFREGPPEDAGRRFSEAFPDLPGPVASIDHTDGVRVTLANGEIVHLRPSGNAPELRCYAEADTPERAEELARLCLGEMEGWRGG